MDYFPAALENLVEQFAKLPGVGRKSAQRLAFYILDQPEQTARDFAAALLDAKKSIGCCPVCQNLTDGEGECPLCASSKRDHSLVCVVADPKDVVAMERSREYRGVYHVLHGVISPMNHVGPDDLRIQQLVERAASGEIEEAVMATMEEMSIWFPKSRHPSRKRGMLKRMTRVPTGSRGRKKWTIWARPVTPPKAMPLGTKQPSKARA